MNKVGYKIVYMLQFHFVKKWEKGSKKEEWAEEKEKEGGMERREEGEKERLPAHPDLGPVAELL